MVGEYDGGGRAAEVVILADWGAKVVRLVLHFAFVSFRAIKLI